MPGRDHRQLIVWQKAMDLVELAYRTNDSVPKVELYGLTSQMRRAALSIPSNVAEGQGRYSASEFVRFLSIVRGPVKEVETQTAIAHRLGYINGDEVPIRKPAPLAPLAGRGVGGEGFLDRLEETTFVDFTDEVSRFITGVRASLRRRASESPPS
jgi:four helix bundle protein